MYQDVNNARLTLNDLEFASKILHHQSLSSWSQMVQKSHTISATNKFEWSRCFSFRRPSLASCSMVIVKQFNQAKSRIYERICFVCCVNSIFVHKSRNNKNDTSAIYKVKLCVMSARAIYDCDR